MPSCDGDARLLTTAGLSRSFGRRRVLHNIDLTLDPGEALAVAGPNGAGKSTLLRLLAGLMRPSAGEVRVMGRPLRGNDGDARRAIGLLSHQTLLYDDLTLLENLTFAARLYGIPRPRETAMAALEQAGLATRADELPRRLSRGLLQRAAIARARLHHPRLLLLDEPFTALDAASADRLRSELRAAVEGGLGLVLVTHQLAEVWGVASRIGVLVEGRWVWEESRPAELEQFVTRYRALVGA